MSINGTIKIDSNVPLPPSGSRRSSKYPFKDMQVGDSFLMPHGTTRTFASATASRAKKYGKFTTRETDEGVRIWRVE